MFLDHIAFRVRNCYEAANFFISAFGYKKQAEFDIFFNDEKTDKATCLALEPSEKSSKDLPFFIEGKYQFPPEIFVSSGTDGSIVCEWVKNRGPGIHHIAWSVPNVKEKQKEWLEKGFGEFASKDPFNCDGLIQIFTKPNLITGVVYEFIEREEFGFCKANVKELMISSKAKLDEKIK